MKSIKSAVTVLFVTLAHQSFAADYPVCALNAPSLLAIEACSKVIERTGNMSTLGWALYVRGLAYSGTQDNARAIADFTSANNVAPYYWPALVNRGMAYEAEGDFERAKADFSAVLSRPAPTAEYNKWAQKTARDRMAAVATAQNPKVKSAPSPAVSPTAQAAVSPTVSATPIISPAAPAALPARPAPSAQVPSTNNSVNPVLSPPGVNSQTTLAQAIESCKPGSASTKSLAGADGAEPVRFDKCFAGRAQMTCVVAALKQEATALQSEYGDLLATDYPGKKDYKAVCAIPAAKIAADVTKAKTFASRAKALSEQANSLSECAERVQNDLTRVQASDLPYGADVLTSLRESIRSDVTAVSNAQRGVLNLTGKVSASERALTTIDSLKKADLCN